ncbi:Cysteine-rich RLK (RECEPTOR-like protein kinase) 8 [Hibiscus syriacus]|uniref:Cysteine-rich RLK (RECEPTOR-like protein kinase) 8 n=1 Tax=Hibiscus syriacus TaxID=106335 RepID=A0A6A3C4B1_HIBSY|nr:Cysteine-rich RLK (RECEPTOR-like protein kinase) 8 [Hibiscus syriacus]
MKGGIGGILRDCNSIILSTFSVSIGPGPPPLAELKAIKKGLDIFLSSDWAAKGRLILESDCKSAVDWIVLPNSVPSFFSSLVEDIVSLVHEKAIIIRWIPRGCNWEADKLAKDGIVSLFNKLRHSFPPSDSYSFQELTKREVVIVDLEFNQITTTEEIPPIPEPELSLLRDEILKLLHPNVVGIDLMKADFCGSSDQNFKIINKPWGEEHDLQLRLIFLKFFASILAGYRNFMENNVTHVFNTQAFLKKRSRATNQPPEPMVAQFLESHGFLDYLESGLGSEENNDNLLDKLQDALGRGQNPLSILPSPLAEPEIITISDPDVGVSGTGAKYCYDRFPSNVRTEEQEEKRKQILAAANGAIEYSGMQTASSPSISSLERAAERERMVLDIKVKLQGLWLRLLKLEAGEDPLSSFEYGTILALIESDAEGIGGSGFVECIREHINSGWHGQLTEEQFIAVKELLKTAISRATSRNDVLTIRDAWKCLLRCIRKMLIMFRTMFSAIFFSVYMGGVTVLSGFGKDISTIFWSSRLTKSAL